MWQTINSPEGNSYKSTSINSLKVGTTTINKPFDITEAFSNYFSNIAPQLNNQLSNSNTSDCHQAAC